MGLFLCRSLVSINCRSNPWVGGQLYAFPSVSYNFLSSYWVKHHTGYRAFFVCSSISTISGLFHQQFTIYFTERNRLCVFVQPSCSRPTVSGKTYDPFSGKFSFISICFSYWKTWPKVPSCKSEFAVTISLEVLQHWTDHTRRSRLIVTFIQVVQKRETEK